MAGNCSRLSSFQLANEEALARCAVLAWKYQAKSGLKHFKKLHTKTKTRSKHGDKGKVLERKDGWCRVSIPGMGEPGWLAVDFFLSYFIFSLSVCHLADGSYL